MTSCSGILGERMVILENLTQPVGTAGKFSINNFCDATRLDVYLASSDLLSVYYSGGDGTLVSYMDRNSFGVLLMPGEDRTMQSQFWGEL